MWDLSNAITQSLLIVILKFTSFSFFLHEEVAYIGSLNPDHRDSVMLMLENGKHVLCEKPLAMNVRQTEEMLRTAAEKKLFLMEVTGACSAYFKFAKDYSSICQASRNLVCTTLFIIRGVLDVILPSRNRMSWVIDITRVSHETHWYS